MYMYMYVCTDYIRCGRELCIELSGLSGVLRHTGWSTESSLLTILLPHTVVCIEEKRRLPGATSPDSISKVCFSRGHG